jgi:hypothetical protein
LRAPALTDPAPRGQSADVHDASPPARRRWGAPLSRAERARPSLGSQRRSVSSETRSSPRGHRPRSLRRPRFTTISGPSSTLRRGGDERLDRSGVPDVGNDRQDLRAGLLPDLAADASSGARVRAQIAPDPSAASCARRPCRCRGSRPSPGARRPASRDPLSSRGLLHPAASMAESRTCRRFALEVSSGTWDLRPHRDLDQARGGRLPTRVPVGTEYEPVTSTANDQDRGARDQRDRQAAAPARSLAYPPNALRPASHAGRSINDDHASG